MTTEPRERVQIYERPARSARDVLAEALNITAAQATDGLIALLRAGFYIGPIEPTNSMLEAYLSAMKPAPKRTLSILNAIGKARRRWKAMAEAGNRVAMSRFSEGGGTVDTASLNLAAGAPLAGSSPAPRTNSAPIAQSDRASAF